MLQIDLPKATETNTTVNVVTAPYTNLLYDNINNNIKEVKKKPLNQKLKTK